MGLIPVLRVLLSAFGTIVVAIGCSIVLFGPHGTAVFFAETVNAFTGGTVLPSGFDTPDVDNEFRFYSVFWLAFGVMLFRAAWTLPDSRTLVLILMGIFFAGGLFRVLSIWQMGWPHPMFQILMWVELVVPVLLSVLVLAGLPRPDRQVR